MLSSFAGPDGALRRVQALFQAQKKAPPPATDLSRAGGDAIVYETAL